MWLEWMSEIWTSEIGKTLKSELLSVRISDRYVGRVMSKIRTNSASLDHLIKNYYPKMPKQSRLAKQMFGFWTFGLLNSAWNWDESDLSKIKTSSDFGRSLYSTFLTILMQFWFLFFRWNRTTWNLQAHCCNFTCHGRL